jgi:histidinol-phosphate aminotransferase
MSLLEQALPYVRSISPYVPGKPITELARELGLALDGIVKLASNENPLGMSTKARAAVSAAIDGLSRYPDPFELIAKLAERLGVEPTQIVLGNGSNDVLELAARVFLAPGRSAVFSEHAFAVYPLATQAAGAACLVAPAQHYGHGGDTCGYAHGLDRQPEQSHWRLFALSPLARFHRAHPPRCRGGAR